MMWANIIVRQTLIQNMSRQNSLTLAMESNILAKSSILKLDKFVDFNRELSSAREYIFFSISYFAVTELDPIFATQVGHQLSHPDCH